MKTLLFAAIFCLLATSARGACSTRILGSAEAAIEDYPYAASIEWREYGHYCGATIITADWLILDAWCTWDPADVSEFIVRVGSAAVGNGTRHNVTEWIFHPTSNFSINLFDFALIKIEPPFELSDTVGPVTLPEQDQATPDSVVGVIAGWGQTETYQDDLTSALLHYANISLISDENCALILGEKYNDSILCALGDKLDVALCWRDEGGPLVVDGVLFGISIWPNCCANPRQVQKFGRVSTIRDWIDATIRA